MLANRFVGPEIGNKECQRELAHLLLASHGDDEALETCHENGWQGVLCSDMCRGGRSHLMSPRPATNPMVSP
jgi:hypothetical protein